MKSDAGKSEINPREIIFRETSDREDRKTPMPGYTTIGRQSIMARWACAVKPSRMKFIALAYDFAKFIHRNEKRDGGRRYFDHPREVAIIAFEELKIHKWWILAVCLLHDVFESLAKAAQEDPFITIAWSWLLRLVFGGKVFKSLNRLSKLPKNDYYQRLVELGSNWDIIAKLVDALHNLRTLYACPEDKQRKQIAEIREVILPLANFLIPRLPSGEVWRGEYLKREIEKEVSKYTGNQASLPP